MTAHDNLVAWVRVFGEHNGARTSTDEGLYMASLPLEYAGFRTAVPVGPTSAASIAAARAFFASDSPAFVIYARPDVDTDLIATGKANQVVELFKPPQMVCTERPALSPNAVVTTDRRDLHGYAVVAGNAFADLNFPADQTTESLDRPSLLEDPRVDLAVAKIDGQVVAGAISVTQNDGCYISFVAANTEARRHGLGDAVTRAVTNAGFDKGATFASLEASPFGYRVYERMGFTETYKYALLVALPPRD